MRRGLWRQDNKIDIKKLSCMWYDHGLKWNVKIIDVHPVVCWQYNVYIYIYIYIYYNNRLTQVQTGQSADRLPFWGEIFRTHPDRPWGPSSILYNAHRVSFRGTKRPGRPFTTRPHLASSLKKEYRYSSTPLCAFVVYSTVTFTFTSLRSDHTFLSTWGQIPGGCNPYFTTVAEWNAGTCSMNSKRSRKFYVDNQSQFYPSRISYTTDSY
jgi:hypothetical protein